MKTTHRSYADDTGDFNRLCRFIIEHNAHVRGFSTWCLGRFVDWKYQLWGDKQSAPGFWGQNAHLWFDGFGELAGLAISIKELRDRLSEYYEQNRNLVLTGQHSAAIGHDIRSLNIGVGSYLSLALRRLEDCPGQGPAAAVRHFAEPSPHGAGRAGWVARGSRGREPPGAPRGAGPRRGAGSSRRRAPGRIGAARAGGPRARAPPAPGS